MGTFELESLPARHRRAPVSVAEIDFALGVQLVVAWAGEAGEERRLGWWRSDLVSEFGGEDLFRRLLPSTWQWAVLQGARETARRRDKEMRVQGHDPDRIVSLFFFGFELDEQIEERLQELKRSGQTPREALPSLVMLEQGWDQARFYEWVAGLGPAATTATPVGRQLKGTMPSGFEQQVRQLVAGLAPAAESYPLPYFLRAG
jgi:hypothetical protein